MRADKQIIAADRRSCALQLGANLAVMRPGVQCKWKNIDARCETVEAFLILGDMDRFFDAVAKLRVGD